MGPRKGGLAGCHVALTGLAGTVARSEGRQAAADQVRTLRSVASRALGDHLPRGRSLLGVRRGSARRDWRCVTHLVRRPAGVRPTAVSPESWPERHPCRRTAIPSPTALHLWEGASRRKRRAFPDPARFRWRQRWSHLRAWHPCLPRIRPQPRPRRNRSAPLASRMPRLRLDTTHPLTWTQTTGLRGPANLCARWS